MSTHTLFLTENIQDCSSHFYDYSALRICDNVVASRYVKKWAVGWGEEGGRWSNALSLEVGLVASIRGTADLRTQICRRGLDRRATTHHSKQGGGDRGKSGHSDKAPGRKRCWPKLKQQRLTSTRAFWKRAAGRATEMSEGRKGTMSRKWGGVRGRELLSDTGGDRSGEGGDVDRCLGSGPPPVSGAVPSVLALLPRY